MDALFTYIPLDRRWALASRSTMPTRTHGAALFADISGFTPLTETLLRELGPKQGPEELSRQLNMVYDALITEVHRYGGAVMVFSGDAITCWLDGDDGLRATACALAMQATMEQFKAIKSPSGTMISLGMKAAVAVGPVRRFQIGDHDIQYMDVLAGATLDRMAAAEGYADRGDVVLDPETAQSLEQHLILAEWRPAATGQAQYAVVEALKPSAQSLLEIRSAAASDVAKVALSEDIAQRWLLPPIYERIVSGQNRFLAEIRPAVSLFLRFGGLDYDADERAGERLDAYIRLVQNILVRYEAYILQLTIGDKGSYLYSSFGAPISHEDDALRAVSASLEIQSLVHQVPFITDVQIGLSQGRVFSGAYGGSMRHTYGVIGDEVNTAARLMGKAQSGQILVNQSIAQATSDHYRFEELGPVKVKGKKFPIFVSAVAGRRTHTQRGANKRFAKPLVGREEEVKKVDDILDALQLGASQILRLRGPAGVGKSHLAAESMNRAQKRGIQVSIGTCQSSNQNIPYYPWRQIVRDLFNFDESMEESTQKQIKQLETVIKRVNPDWLVRLPLLGNILDLPISDNSFTEAFDPQVRQQALFSLMIDLTQALAQQQPLLIALDDAHWLDEASAELILTLARATVAGQTESGIPLMLMITQRPSAQQDASALADLYKLPNYHALEINDLAREGVAQLITNLLDGPPDPLCVSLIHTRSQGHPLFVEELISNLRDIDGLDQMPDGSWRVSQEIFKTLLQANYLTRNQQGDWILSPTASLSSVQLGMPDSIQGLVLSRLDRLSELNRTTLKVASVIGRAFEFDLLARSHPARGSKGRLLSEMNILEARGFTLMEAPPPRLSYGFRNNTVHDVVYDTMLLQQQRQLHQEISRHLEYYAPDRIEALAYHSYQGQDWERALRYQMLAAEEAQKLFANREAIDHFAKALDSAQHIEGQDMSAEILDLHNRLGELLTLTGQYESGITHLKKALDLARAQQNRPVEAQVCHWLARSHEFQGQYEPAFDWIEEGLAALTAQETIEAAELLLIAGLINTRQGEYDMAIELCEKSLRIAQSLEEENVVARAYNLMGDVRRARGENALAIEYFQKAIQMYEVANNMPEQANTFNLIATAYLYTGQWSKADKYYRQAKDIFEQTGNIYKLVFVDNNLGEIARNQGKLEEALSFYQTSLRLLEQIGGSTWVRGAINNNLGATYIKARQPTLAQEHLNISKDLFEEAQARDFFLPEMHFLFAEAALLQNDIEAAEEEAEQALALARELTVRNEEGLSLRVLGQVRVAQADWEGAQENFTASLDILTDIGAEFEAARTQLTLAQLYQKTDQPEAARDMLTACLPTLTRLGARIELEEAAALQEKIGVASQTSAMDG